MTHFHLPFTFKPVMIDFIAPNIAFQGSDTIIVISQSFDPPNPKFICKRAFTQVGVDILKLV